MVTVDNWTVTIDPYRQPVRAPSDVAGGSADSVGSDETAAAPQQNDRDRERLSVVESYADRVLEVGRDRWSGEDTPLLADGVHVDTHDPVVWR